MASRRLVPVLLLSSALALGGCSIFGEGADARAAADDLAAALQKGDVPPGTFAGEGAEDAADEYDALTEPLADYETTVSVDQVTRSGGESDVRLVWNVNLDGHIWKHTTKVAFVKRDDEWRPVWKPSIVASGLEPGRTLRVSSIKPERGRILGADDRPLVLPRPVVRFGIDKVGLGPEQAVASARRLAGVMGVSPEPFVKQVRASGPKAFVEVITLRRAQAEPYLGRIRGVKGARGISDRRPLAPTKEFAAQILGTVGPATAEAIEKSDGRLRAGDDTGLSGLQLRYDEQLFGARGVRVSAVAEKGDGEPEVLFEADPEPGTDLRTSLEPRLQQKADDLLRGIGPASAIVAIRPSSGSIVAAASGPGGDGYNTATFGQYAPGSTFKVVSSLALLRAGVTPATTVSCPTTTTVDGKGFKNYDDYPSDRVGRITLTQAVANSCNTAFIGQRDRVSGTALADAAAALGLGVDHDLGFPAYFGQVPQPGSKTEAAADLIGQGKVLASPMAMAAVTASVVKGATVLPVLLPDHEVPPTAEPRVPLTGSEAIQLRGLMRAVVTEGSGRALGSLGSEVIAKTGTAEYGTGASLPTHAWMIAARGDLAVAVFVATGESGSRTAGPLLGDFLRFAGG